MVLWYPLGDTLVYNLIGMCEHMDSKEINERGSRSEKIWKAALLRPFKEAGVTQLNEGNADCDAVKPTRVEGRTGLCHRARSCHFQFH